LRAIGLFRIFIDEGEPLGTLLQEIMPCPAGEALVAYANRLLAAFRCEPARPATSGDMRKRFERARARGAAPSGRGTDYDEIGRQLFLSLNTVQFHVQEHLQQAAGQQAGARDERAREMQLI